MPSRQNTVGNRQRASAIPTCYEHLFVKTLDELLTGQGRTVSKIAYSITNSVGAWRSLEAHLNGVQGVGGSNPLAPTRSRRLHNSFERALWTFWGTCLVGLVYLVDFVCFVCLVWSVCRAGFTPLNRVPFGKFNGGSGQHQRANHKLFEAVRPCFWDFASKPKVHTKE